mgnify:CR=1 FL=1
MTPAPSTPMDWIWSSVLISIRGQGLELLEETDIVLREDAEVVDAVLGQRAVGGGGKEVLQDISQRMDKILELEPSATPGDR